MHSSKIYYNTIVIGAQHFRCLIIIRTKSRFIFWIISHLKSIILHFIGQLCRPKPTHLMKLTPSIFFCFYFYFMYFSLSTCRAHSRGERPLYGTKKGSVYVCTARLILFGSIRNAIVKDLYWTFLVNDVTYRQICLFLTYLMIYISQEEAKLAKALLMSTHIFQKFFSECCDSFSGQWHNISPFRRTSTWAVSITTFSTFGGL